MNYIKLALCQLCNDQFIQHNYLTASSLLFCVLCVAGDKCDIYLVFTPTTYVHFHSDNDALSLYLLLIYN